MDVVRKSIGVLIIILIGGPVLFGVIWAVGVTRAVISPEFLSDLPKEIIEKVPAMVDEVLIEVNREDMIQDPNRRAWVKAVATAETSPRELLAKIGLLDWMQNELSVKFQEMGKMLRGEIPLKPLVMDLRPLKAGLRHEAIKEYLVDLLKSLPVCDDTQKAEWEAAATNPKPLEELPACQPPGLDLAISTQAIDFVREHEIEDIPDEVNIFKSNHRFHKGVDFMHNVISYTYLLFLIPAVLFAAGWLRPPYAVVGILILLLVIYVGFKELRQETRQRKHQWENRKLFYCAIVFLMLSLWILLSGIGGFGFQNSDYGKHNGLLKDLIEQ
ncbi:MAG: hypothetical protein MUF15_20375, partial [Acidobacteria bacterium]|nr:hypothetical protein [Acidobacteriota bacterium]